ncbi:unnamed protein product [Arctia plantaginis]|uniref:Uncharacterized protein n=1 Tax=Arctia plantaginis TaxID=874455 RepID=A0A8S1BJ04_ARCPL|nr:unnamed protein product [Arctia plantaginis]
MVDPSYADSWLSQPDVCRCCLSANGTWDVTSTYITEAGENEVYSTMLLECYGITLSNLLEWGPSRMVCAFCVSRLRDATNFRKQVILADQHFEAYCNSIRPRVFKPVILKADSPHDQRNSSDSDDDDVKTIDVLALTDSTEAPIVDRISTKKKSDQIGKKRYPRTDIDDDLESDTPMSEVSRKNNVTESIDERTVIADDPLDQDSVDGARPPPKKSFIYTRPQNVQKQVSERKRIILTCDVVLRDTNACPFRHHKSWFQCFFCQQDFMEINLLRNHTVTNHSNIDNELKKIKRYPRSLQIEISNLECIHCHLKLTDVSSMRGHFVDVHKKVIYNECIADYKVDGTPYSCHLCDQQFHVFRSLTTHLNDHYANCICDVCERKVAYENMKFMSEGHITNQNLRSNITLVLKYTTVLPFKQINNNQFFCHYCDKPYLLFKDLKNHIKVRHWNITEAQIKRTIRCPKDLVKADVSDISCRLCGSNYNTIEKLVEHLKGLHSKTFHMIPDLKHSHGILGFDLSEGKLRCAVCAKEFKFFKKLSIHMNDHDTDYICHICGKRFVARHRLATHVARHRSSEFKCNFCSKKFKSASAKDCHTRKAHKPLKFKCPECPQEFAQYLHRLKHMAERHKFKKPDFRCEHCSKVFAHHSALAKHIKHSHFQHEIDKFLCEICDKIFSSKWLAERHLITHTGKKNFECEYCSKKFAKKYTLDIHVKTHLDERKHACPECESAFVQKISLIKHVKAIHPNLDIKTL